MTTLNRQQVEEMLKNKPAGVDDETIIRSLVNRGFQLEGLNLPSREANKPDLLRSSAKVASTIFGAEKIGEAVGTQIAKATVPEGQRQFVGEGPTNKELTGDILRTGAIFTPVGKIAGLVGKGAAALGLGTKTAQIAGNIAGGATAGALADVGTSIAEGEAPQLGLGTAIGAGIPAASPVAGALVRASTKLAGKIGSESVGALTGTSAETIEQAYTAAKAGGQDLEKYTAALRGKTTPEALVNTMREQIDSIASQRQALYKETLNELSDSIVSTVPAKQSFLQTLNKFKVSVDDKGQLVFNKSELRTVPAAQSKIQQAWDEIRNMPDQLAIGDLDTTRQAIKAIKLVDSGEASANKANSIVEDAVRSVRKAGEQVDGYGQMLDNFAETSDFLEELQRGISSGDRATIDQTYRRMATTLKTNNEQRMALVRELDNATDGAILSQISGQQLSELYPRGIFRQILAGSAGLGAITGTITPAIFPTLVMASPRVAGEFVRALGIGAAKADIMIETIGQARNLLIKAGAITGAESDI